MTHTSTSADSTQSTALAKDLLKVDENHAVLSYDNVPYVLDSFIIPFAQPYYILIQRQDKQLFDKNTATKIAIDYIKPRGCTVPLQRRSELDKQNSNGSQYLIGVGWRVDCWSISGRIKGELVMIDLSKGYLWKK
ncbi:hypothetical protein [Psychrobacter sp. I-STPA10]|uniref:hypothetical protein n=1 Tax=Psychrobacter sp. I-STPA10 TaxID=2585769 RepID=UPI001E3D7966|nr:hypothetical protein [Psychrobacter sp. I-STPA10]